MSDTPDIEIDYSNLPDAVVEDADGCGRRQVIELSCDSEDVGGSSVDFVVAKLKRVGHTNKTAKLKWTVKRGCDIEILRVEPSENCTFQEVGRHPSGKYLCGNLSYINHVGGPSEVKAEVEYAVVYRAANGSECEAYGGKPVPFPIACSEIGLEIAPNPRPKAEFP